MAVKKQRFEAVDQANDSRESGRFATRLPDWLAYLYTPILPLLWRIHLRRQKVIYPDGRDVLVPSGYVAEVVATGFNAPDHCAFDDQGNCYVVESGRKITQPPRILNLF